MNAKQIEQKYAKENSMFEISETIQKKSTDLNIVILGSPILFLFMLMTAWMMRIVDSV